MHGQSTLLPLKDTGLVGVRTGQAVRTITIRARYFGWLALFALSSMSLLYHYGAHTVHSHAFSVSQTKQDFVSPIDTPGTTDSSPAAPKVHLLFALDKGSINRRSCTTLASALIHGYQPIILNWSIYENVTSGAPRENFFLAKQSEMLRYLDNMRHTMQDQDLVLLSDGSDVLFQLPPENLSQKFFLINDHRAAGQELVIVGADKGCWPNNDFEPDVCGAAPMSPLPWSAYGDEPGTFRDSHNRPRWANSGTIVGTAKQMRYFYGLQRAHAKWGQWMNEQQPLNEMLPNASDIFTLDYYSQITWTGGSDFDSVKFVSVPRALDGIRSMIPYGARLPQLAIIGVTGEIPVSLHLNLSPGPASWDDQISKEEGMKLVLQHLWWSSGDERFSRIARELLAAGKILIHDDADRAYTYTEICGENVNESSFLNW